MHFLNEDLRYLVKQIMRPGDRLMASLELHRKLVLLFLTLLLPILVLALTAFVQQFSQIKSIKNELAGVALSHSILNVMIDVQNHRGQMNLKLAGAKIDADLNKTRASLKSSLAEMDKVLAEHDAFGLAAEWKNTASDLHDLAAGKVDDSIAASFTHHTHLINEISRFSFHSNDATGLLLDPDAKTYFLMDISVELIPAWVEHLAILRGKGAGFIQLGHLDLSEKIALNSQIDLVQDSIDNIARTAKGLERSGERLPIDQQLAIDASQSFIELVRQRVIKEGRQVDAIDYFTEGSQAIQRVMVLQKRLNDRLYVLLDERMTAFLWQRVLGIFLLILTLLTTTYLVYGFYRGFMQAIRVVGDSALSVASGDLTNTIKIHGQDELAKTGDIIEEMNFNLSALVANVRTNASMVSQLGQHLAVGISDLTVRTEQQAAYLEQTTLSIDALTSTVQKNAQSANAVNALATNLSQIAGLSGDKMHSAVTTMQDIQSSALQVQEIVSIIDGIAFQTSILALNAAVEAARAGEQGKGFAVVATEVRELAQRSASSARQIRRLIDASVARVESGVEQIDEVNLTLTEIVEGIQQLALNVSSISYASTEQSEGLAKISESIRDLDNITQSNGDMAAQAKHSSITLGERAIQLTNAVATFKLRQGTADEAYKLVKRAIGSYRINGSAVFQTITDDMDKLYSDRDMFVFVFDRQGKYLAYAKSPSQLSVNILATAGLDGRKLLFDAFLLPHSGGWIDYTIMNRATNRIESKSAYIEKIEDDIVMGCGVFKVS